MAADEFYMPTRRLKGYTGGPPKECLGQRAIRFVHHEDRRAVFKAARELGDEGAFSGDLECRLVGPSGHIRHVMWNLDLEYDDRAGLTGIRLIGRDISQMKKSLEELHESEQIWNTFFMSSPTWILVVTLDEGIILDINDAFCRDTGYSKEESLGRATNDIGLWPDPGDRDRTLALIKPQGGIDKLPIKLRVKNGELRDFLWSTVIIEVRNKKCLLSVLVDVTDLKRTEKELEETNTELHKRSSELAEMNAALKVLLKQREEDKKDLETRVWHNIKKMIQPHLHNLKMSGLSAMQQAHLDVAISRMNDIASNLGTRLGHEAYGLTSRELEVVGYIIEGQTNKDIASILNISVHSVESHRFSIRKKLGLLGRNVNLRTHLLAMSR